MAQIVIDDAAYTPAGAPRTVGDVLNDVRQALAARRRIITSLSCDGTIVASSEIDAAMHRSLAGIGRLELASEPLYGLVLSILRAARSEFPQVQLLRNTIAERLTAGDTAAAMDDLRSFVQALGQMHQAVSQSAAALGLNVLEPLAADAAGKPVIETLARCLRDMREALSQRDMVLLSDQMRYELPAILEAWERLVDGMVVRIEALALDDVPAENAVAAAPFG